tara:strand:- start:193 stop:432 length:240 start_codon:yes stop_codon:yes gene_type:complete
MSKFETLDTKFYCIVNSKTGELFISRRGSSLFSGLGPASSAWWWVFGQQRFGGKNTGVKFKDQDLWVIKVVKLVECTDD